MPTLTVETVSKPDSTIVALIGAADMSGADELDRQITRLCALHAPNLVFDLTRLTFISSICMGALVRYRNAARRWNGTVTLAGANEIVADALRRARLDQVFDIRPTLDSAPA